MCPWRHVTLLCRISTFQWHDDACLECRVSIPIHYGLAAKVLEKRKRVKRFQCRCNYWHDWWSRTKMEIDWFWWAPRMQSAQHVHFYAAIAHLQSGKRKRVDDAIVDTMIVCLVEWEIDDIIQIGSHKVIKPHNSIPRLHTPKQLQIEDLLINQPALQLLLLRQINLSKNETWHLGLLKRIPFSLISWLFTSQRHQDFSATNITLLAT